MRKKLLLSLMCVMLIYQYGHAQQRSVSGRVTSSDDGSPLPGVNVVLKGTSTGSVTDISGNYIVQVPVEGGILVYSFIGLKTQEIEVGEQTTIDIAMEQDVAQLGEVVVTALGIEREKRALGYSVQEVKNEELVKTRQTSLLTSLQGKIAGAQITNAGGGLGSSTSVILRGPASLLSNNEALFVVDGIPISNGSSVNVQSSGNFYDNIVDAGNRANDINPEDIESVSVLKGPSATALYGSRAAHGVILITTKRGSNRGPQKTEITFNSAYVWSQVLVLPKLQNRFGQGQFGDNQHYLEDQENWGDPFDGSLRPFGQIVNNLQQYKPYVAQPDNLKDFYDIGTSFQNSLSLNGGNENATYYLSFNDFAQTGVVPGTDYHRNNVTLNGSTRLANKVNTSASMNYVRIDANLPQTGQNNQALGQILNFPRDFSFVDMKDLSNPFNTPDGFFSPYVVNPYYGLAHDYSKQNLNRVYGDFRIDYDPASWMNAMLRVGTDIVSDQRNTFADIVVYNDPNGPNYEAAANIDGEYTEQSINTRQVNADLIVTMNHQINEKIQGSLLLGYNFNQRDGESLFATASSLTIPGFDNLSNVNGTYSAGGTSNKRRLFGAYTSLDLSYNGYLFLGASFRNDWSSTLPSNNRSFNYPGVNIGFVATDAFKVTSKVLSYGKIRASYAKAGNDAPVYIINSVFTQPLGGFFDYPVGSFAVIDFPFNNGSVSVPGFTEANTIGNQNLQPEITKSFETGLELKLWQGRVNLDFAYYNSLSEKQIIPAPISPSSGYRSEVLNIGTISNKGVEITLGGKVLEVAGLRWDINLNFTKNNSLVEELNEGASELKLLSQGLTPGLSLIKGKPYGVFEVTTVLRNDEGKIVVDNNGIPQNDPNPKIKGTLQPDWLGGLTSSLSYKGFELSATLDKRKGGNIVSSTMAQLYFGGMAEETAFNDREAWVVPNAVKVVGEDDEGNPEYAPNDIPLTMETNTLRDYWSNIQGGDRNEVVLLDASYVKLRELALTYNLSAKWLERTPFGNASIGIIGRNLWVHTAKDNHTIDPEGNAFGNGGSPGYRNLQGFEYYGIPTQASYGFNLRATF